MLKTFISHSSLDKPIVRQLANILTAEKAWYDEWDMDTGDILADKIEKGIDEAKNFLLILSKNSIKSSWVRLELNMALIKYLQEEDYKIIVARIDDVEIPLRLKPFLRIDCPTSENIAQEIYKALIKEKGDINKSIKRRFINRQEEVSNLEDLLHEEEVKFINIIGFYGIGKTSLVEEALKRIYSNSNYILINLSAAHFGSRLTIELCSKADLPLPEDGESLENLYEKNILAIETLLSKGRFIIFNRFESVLNDDSTPNDDIIYILNKCYEYKILGEFPLFFLSTRWPDFSPIGKEKVNYLRVGGLTDKHLSFLLKNEIQRISNSFVINDDELKEISNHLHGYPLAAKLAAPIIVRYGNIQYLLDNLHIVNQIKIDIAEDIISKFEFSEIEIKILELLAIFGEPLNPRYIPEVAEIDSEQLNESIDILSGCNIVENDGRGILLHPLVSDFYLKLARSTSNFILFAEKLSDIAKNKLKSLNNTDKDYVYWLTSTCRLLFYCGKLEEGRKLRRDLLGEIKDAAIKLYQNNDYKNSFKFSEYFLETYPHDKDILFTKARCLSRFGDLDLAVEILEDLIKYESSRFRKAKYYYAIGRSYLENSHDNDEYLDFAEEALMKSLSINEHQSALQSMSELLFRKDNYTDALSFIIRKLDISPTDPFALSLHADILWALNQKPQALGQIIEALNHQPKNPKFLFRAGRFMQEHDKLQAYGFYNKAVDFDSDYFDARLSLADVCIDIDFLDEAEAHLKHISDKLTGDKRNIYDSISASLAIKQNDIDKAEKLASNLLRKRRDPRHLGLVAKVHIEKYRQNLKKGFGKLAETDRSKAVSLINEGLSLEPDNQVLINMLNSF